MRPDMSKAIVEKERTGSRLKYRDVRRKIANRNHDDYPLKQGMTRVHSMYGRDRKMLNENLGPLSGFLDRAVGRKWDDVYSEICSHIKVASTVQEHILSHLKDFVQVKVLKGDDGKLYSCGQCWSGKLREVDRLYVDPDDGVLRMPAGHHHRRGWRRPVAPKPIDRIVLAPERELHKVDGIWYWAIFANCPTYNVYDLDRDANVVLVRTVTQGGGDVFGLSNVGGRYRCSKRQASSRDLRTHGLANDPPGDK